MRSKFALLVFFIALSSARGAYAQGCALCYTTASAAGAGALFPLRCSSASFSNPLNLKYRVFFLSVAKRISDRLSDALDLRGRELRVQGNRKHFAGSALADSQITRFASQRSVKRLEVERNRVIHNTRDASICQALLNDVAAGCPARVISRVVTCYAARYAKGVEVVDVLAVVRYAWKRDTWQIR